ncbi:MAG: hypothetical protein AB1726_03780 [Planctomycetota bacterium]
MRTKHRNLGAAGRGALRRAAPIPALLLTATLALAAGGQSRTSPQPGLAADHCPRVADPKLAGGEIPIRFWLFPPGEVFHVAVWVTRGAAPGPVRFVDHVWAGDLTGSSSAITIPWDGKDFQARFVTPGDYEIHVAATGASAGTLVYPVRIVRLGIREVEALSSAGLNEWQMVYFRKAGTYAFYATPAVAEYVNRAAPGEVADLDRDDGAPRPAVPVHPATDEPVMEGASYEVDTYNYPLCYLRGAAPRFEATLGSTATSGGGVPLAAGYPLAGIELRMLAGDDTGAWTGTAEGIVPGGSYAFTGPPLPDRATRVERTVRWSWQYRETGSTDWLDVPGALETAHRFYTILGTPVWTAGASGTQYAGPWVEVAEYLHSFATALAIDPADEAGVVKALIRGYFGQEGPLATAIEGVIYDTYTMGGDGGANHYYLWSGNRTRLSRLLDNHANGVYVNCSDVASSSSVMLGMLGVPGVQMVYIGDMDLRAIWGIGCPGYTLDLWGWGPPYHGFSYHHIVTRDAAVHVSDACLWVDEDGDPDTLPGVPGYNCDRLWSGPNGYSELSATNNPTKSLDPLPGIL